MENKLTAVQFLSDNLHYLHSTKWDDILIKAKEMEKEQIIDAYIGGYSAEQHNVDSEKYYNDRFNK